MRNTKTILGVKFDIISRKDAILQLKTFVDKNRSSIITTPNTEFIIEANRNEEFLKILNQKSSLNLADGAGILWADKFLSIKTVKSSIIRHFLLVCVWLLSFIFYPLFIRSKKGSLVEKISGSDFLWDIAKFAADNNLKLYLLGAGPTVAERAALKLQTDIYNLKIAGVNDASPDQTEKIIENINKTHADILVVAYGSPKQELWLAKNLHKTGCKIGIGVGGSFDFIAGERKRAPKIIQKLGFEWLFRLILEPNRIKRQVSIPKFMYLVLKSQLAEK